MKKKHYLIITVLVMVLMLSAGMTCFAESSSTTGTHGGGGRTFDDVFTAIKELAADSQVFVLAISSAAAVVGAATGALMKKFSMGNEKKLSTGNKVIVGSVVGWAAVNGMPLLLNTVGIYL